MYSNIGPIDTVRDERQQEMTTEIRKAISDELSRRFSEIYWINGIREMKR